MPSQTLQNDSSGAVPGTAPGDFASRPPAGCARVFSAGCVTMVQDSQTGPDIDGLTHLPQTTAAS